MRPYIGCQSCALCLPIYQTSKMHELQPIKCCSVFTWHTRPIEWFSILVTSQPLGMGEISSRFSLLLIPSDRQLTILLSPLWTHIWSTFLVQWNFFHQTCKLVLDTLLCQMFTRFPQQSILNVALCSHSLLSTLRGPSLWQAVLVPYFTYNHM